jgi:ribosomal protein S6
MPEDKYTAMVDRIKSAVTVDGKGEFLYSDDWGRSKIAYTIGKDNRGRWTYFRYKALPQGPNEIQRTLGINEFVLRSMTNRAQENGSDYEPLRANMAQDLADREKVRDWKEERYQRRSGGDRYRRDDRYQDEDRSAPTGGNEDEGGADGAEI